MFVRVTKFEVKSDKLDEARAAAHDIKPLLREIAGLKEIIDAVNDDGKAVVVALYEDEAAATAAAPQVGEIWGSLAHLLASEPQPEGYAVFMRELFD